MGNTIYLSFSCQQYTRGLFYPTGITHVYHYVSWAWRGGVIHACARRSKKSLAVLGGLITPAIQYMQHLATREAYGSEPVADRFGAATLGLVAILAVCVIIRVKRNPTGEASAYRSVPAMLLSKADGQCLHTARVIVRSYLSFP